jgi:hypothetical protein
MFIQLQAPGKDSIKSKQKYGNLLQNKKDTVSAITCII